MPENEHSRPLESTDTTDARTQQISRREVIALFGGLVGTVVVAKHSELIKGLLDIAASYVAPPNAPFSDEVIEHEKNYYLQKYMQLYNEMRTNFSTRFDETLLESKHFKWPADAWPSSQAVAAAYVGTLLPEHVASIVGRDHTEWMDDFDRFLSIDRKHNRIGFGTNWRDMPDGAKDIWLTDDGNWIARLAMRLYKQTGDHIYFDVAHTVYFLNNSQAAVDQDGGIYWEVRNGGNTNHDRGVVSSGPMAALALDLYNVTGRAHQPFLDKAVSLYTWLTKKLLDEKTGMLADHVDANGELDQTIWPYTQMRAELIARFSQVLPKRFKMQDAVDVANANLDFFEREESIEELTGQPRQGFRGTSFTAIMLESFMYVAALADDDRLKERLQTIAQRLTHQMQISHGDLLEQSGAVRIAGLAALDPKKYGLLV